MASLFARGLADSLPTAQPQRRCNCLPRQRSSIGPTVCGYAHSAQLQQRYWLDQSRHGGACQWTIRGNNTVASTQQVSTSLSVEETQALLQEVPKAYNTQINDVLTALVQALLNGRAIALSVDLEGHGREEIFDDVDVSRTVGWFCFRYS